MKQSISRSVIAGTVVSILALVVAGCATESHQALAVEKSTSAATAPAYNGPKHALAVGKFDNRSSYLRGLFSDGVDRLGGQAKTILIGHLQQTGRFQRDGPRQHGENARERSSPGRSRN